MLIDIAIHVHIIVTRHGQSFKTPPAYETLYTRRVRRASGLVLARYPLVMGHRQLRHTGRFLTNNGPRPRSALHRGRFVTPEIERSSCTETGARRRLEGTWWAPASSSGNWAGPQLARTVF